MLSADAILKSIDYQPMQTPVYQNQLPKHFSSWTHLYHSMRLWTPLAMATASGESGEMSFMMSERDSTTEIDGQILLDVDFLKARLFEEIIENCEFDLDLAKRVRALAFTHPNHNAIEDTKVQKVINGIIYLSGLRFDHDGHNKPEFLSI